MADRAFQLVIQFPQSAFRAFDDLIAYDDRLNLVLGEAHDMDGHDIGAGEVNFFVLTAHPGSALDLIRTAGGESLLGHPDVRVAVRSLSEDTFEVVWPLDDDGEFTVA